jgi:aspartate-semialdehyde dehydrogenase
VPDEVSAEWVPRAAAQGVVVIDKSGTFRMDPDVPLVVPEINPEQIRNRPKGIIANANCTTLAMIVAIAPLHREYGLKELVLASYQAASGAGCGRAETLYDQVVKVAGDRQLGSRTGQRAARVGDDLGPFPAPLVFNVVPWAGLAQERRLVQRRAQDAQRVTQDPWLPDLKVSATCVRVPVITGHSIAVHAVFGSEVDADSARDVLGRAPGVIVVDDPAAASSRCRSTRSAPTRRGWAASGVPSTTRARSTSS